jgi:hypothetical protein
VPLKPSFTGWRRRETDMYVPIVLLIFVVALVAGHFFLSWLLVETKEERGSAEERARGRAPRSFYNHRTWAAFRRLISKKPALLTYRRDRSGRFRTLTPSPPKQVARPVKPRSSNRRRRPPARRKPARRPSDERPLNPLS